MSRHSHRQSEQYGSRGGQQMHGVQGWTIDESLPEDVLVSLDDLAETVAVCEWCADQCVEEGPEMAECIRLCHDTAELAKLNMTFIAKDSPFSDDLLETFVYAAQECADECSRHSMEHCQDCVDVLDQTVDSVDRILGFAGSSQQFGTY